MWSLAGRSKHLDSPDVHCSERRIAWRRSRYMKVTPFGSWASPITSELIVAGSVRLGDVLLDGDDVYWHESRPAESGRYVIVRRAPDGTTSDVNSAPINARTRVHEYGGGSFTIVDGVVFYVNYADQRLFRQDPGGEPRPITPAIDLRYADFAADRASNRLICVREDHRSSDQDAENTIAAVGMTGGSTDDGGI